MAAVDSVRKGHLSERKAAAIYNILKSTINWKKNLKNMKLVGRPAVFSNHDEEELVSDLIFALKWGYFLTAIDIRCIVKSYIDTNGITVPFFKQNFPGVCWTRSFLKRNKDTLTVRLSENIKRSRSGIDHK